MQKIPSSLLASLEHIKGFDKAAFEKVHASGDQITSIRLNPSKFAYSLDNRADIPEELKVFQDLPFAGKVPWSEYGYYLSERPSFTFDPLFHAGCYYVQEASSMFLEEIVKQNADLSQPLRVLDLCAAPGGKSTHLQTLLAPGSILVSNEVIRSRVNILAENLIKWGGNNVVVTNNDPADFRSVQGYFDVIVADAPCSGSGLFRRDAGAIKEWSENNVMLCSRRQQRILADVLPALKNGGILIYSTCSYSIEEDEEMLDWMMGEFKLNSVPVQLKDEWNISEVQTEKSRSYSYRFWPHRIKGEGFFIACLRKNDGVEFTYPRMKQVPLASKKEAEILSRQFEEPGQFSFLPKHSNFYAIPSSLKPDAAFLNAVLNVKYFGTEIGQVINDLLVPAHAFAVSCVLKKELPAIELTREQSLQFLRKQELSIDFVAAGWAIVRYNNINLGWIKALPNRINNYYPKEWRILKQ